MFEGLKKKLSKFVSGLSKKEEERFQETQHAKVPEQSQPLEPAPVAKEHPSVEETAGPGAAVPSASSTAAHVEAQRPREALPAEKRDTKHMPVNEPQEHKHDAKAEGKPQEHIPRDAAPQPRALPSAQQNPEGIPGKAAEHAPVRKEHPRATTATKIKGIFLREVKVKDEDIEPFIEELRTSLLQSDVNYDAAEKILNGIRKGLVDKKLSSRGIDSQITQVIRASILDILKKKVAIDLLKIAAEKKSRGEMPLRILFIGPNGAGKTTTMAKLAHMFLKNGFSCVLSASDTFRAAAIEQTAIHAQRLGINVVKGTYGSDPASVAFDAIAHARAHHIDVVLIDSAGRQETNKSLMDEVKKMVRVAKPDLKIFVGESIAGNMLLDQVREFNAAVGLDGVILTKLDCDAKGGNTLSIISEADVPVIYFGLGEGYDDIMSFNPEFIADSIVQNN
ncbi:MAG: signal recognition particle-docking protein FtsY [Candidatus Marsarchaeota archaeon]|nr:signal recognition particle-docking protein FtsY [Candidatus Marsarchaeota archaeon]